MRGNDSGKRGFLKYFVTAINSDYVAHEGRHWNCFGLSRRVWNMENLSLSKMIDLPYSRPFDSKRLRSTIWPLSNSRSFGEGNTLAKPRWNTTPSHHWRQKDANEVDLSSYEIKKYSGRSCTVITIWVMIFFSMDSCVCVIRRHSHSTFFYVLPRHFIWPMLLKFIWNMRYINRYVDQIQMQ